MPNVFEEITAISSAIIGASLVTLIVLLIIGAARARTAGKRFEEKLQQAVDDLKPLLDDLRPLLYDLRPLVERGKAISEDVASIARTVRENVDQVGDTVTAANDRVRAALEATEERLAEFDALISVVQGEAEDIFVSTAAAVRGVRGGAASLRRRRGTNLASVEAEDDAANDESSDKEEGDDGIDERPEKESPAPRLRPRAPRPRAS
ncbi:MAG TPA: hypothetical protein VGQ44_19870 [Gemmatimonadaceae bacterium]|jgi:uncharacterized protein YoxC|nr:hypothetical protein [Gemmatimonadaceae bacterium]